MEKTRQYHSTALLLPDGRVLSAGGGVCGTCARVGYLEKNAEVFSPPYLFKDDVRRTRAAPGDRRAPKVVGYDAPLPIRSPDADSIEKVALIRVSAVTHSVNMEQRYVPLDYDLDGTTLAATSPENANIAPPGVYMLFVIDEDGVPSESKMVRIDLGRSRSAGGADEPEHRSRLARQRQQPRGQGRGTGGLDGGVYRHR